MGDDIPISAQVVALADVYDALTSRRVYKPPFSHEEALRMIREGECGAFNPLILECLTAVAGDLEKRLNHGITGREISIDSLHLSEATLDNGDAEASSRTLELLDYERMKYHFFASMSNDEAFCATFGKENLEKLSRLLRATTIDDPVIDMEMEATVGDELRWFHVLARALWSGPSDPVYLGSIGKLIDVDDRQAELIDLQFKAYHDPLTEVVNGAFARKIIAERLGSGEACDRHRDRHVLALCDLDFFKQANDTYGHQFGDRVLKHFAERLQESVRGEDVVARVGGDEFLLCMECPVDPRPLIDRIHRSLEGDFEGFPLSVSMGVAIAGSDVRDYDELFRRADVALYHKKRGGRSGYVFYSDLDEEERDLLLEGAHTALSGIDRDESDQ